jgi:hypothetical protein
LGTNILQRRVDAGPDRIEFCHSLFTPAVAAEKVRIRIIFDPTHRRIPSGKIP